MIADVKGPVNKILGVRHSSYAKFMKLYKVHELGLPDRWSNFDTFRSEVSRLVLLSERGRTHGSIWGVPPFLEGVLKATIVVTTTGSETVMYTVTMPRPSSPSPQQPSPQPQEPPSQRSQPLNCTEILNDPSKKGSREWCYCAKYNAPKLYEENIDLCEPPQQYCLYVFPELCCSGGISDPSNAECVSSWSSSPGTACATFKASELKNGVKRELVASWEASWTLKRGWEFAGAAPRESGASCRYAQIGNSVYGTCRASVPPSQYVHVVVVFKKQEPQNKSPSSSSGSGSGGSGGGGGWTSGGGSSGGSTASSSQPSQQQSQQPSYSYDPTQQYQQQQQNPGSSQQNRPPDYAYGGGGGGGPGVPKYFT